MIPTFEGLRNVACVLVGCRFDIVVGRRSNYELAILAGIQPEATVPGVFTLDPLQRNDRGSDAAWGRTLAIVAAREDAAAIVHHAVAMDLNARRARPDRGRQSTRQSRR